MKKLTKVKHIGLCVICLLICCIYVLYKRYTAYQEQQEFKELEQEVSEQEQLSSVQEIIIIEDEEVPITETVPEEILEEKTILPEYEKLYSENPDLYGWIKIEDTVIDYPVMHTPDNPNYYIHRNWKKEETNAGSIFVDARTNESTENIIVYGHNMKNRTMFGSLREYKDKSYYEKHKYIEFNNIYEKETYEIIAVAKAIVYYEEQPSEGEYLFYEHVELNSEQEFKAYIENAKSNSYFEIDETAEFGDKLITLCTCDYWTENARLLVIAKKI